jgi:hypothetical protein
MIFTGEKQDKQTSLDALSEVKIEIMKEHRKAKARLKELGVDEHFKLDFALKRIEILDSQLESVNKDIKMMESDTVKLDRYEYFVKHRKTLWNMARNLYTLKD